jgi:hypothetical protein
MCSITHALANAATFAHPNADAHAVRYGNALPHR